MDVANVSSRSTVDFSYLSLEQFSFERQDFKHLLLSEHARRVVFSVLVGSVVFPVLLIFGARFPLQMMRAYACFMPLTAGMGGFMIWRGPWAVHKFTYKHVRLQPPAIHSHSRSVSSPVAAMRPSKALFAGVLHHYIFAVPRQGAVGLLNCFVRASVDPPSVVVFATHAASVRNLITASLNGARHYLNSFCRFNSVVSSPPTMGLSR